MNYGSGGIAFTNNSAGGSVPPFPVTAANNGLSVDPGTGKIVLGNDIGLFTAQLLSDRYIPMDTFEIYYPGNVVNEYFAIRNTGSGAPAMLAEIKVNRDTPANAFLGQNVSNGASALLFSQIYNDNFRGLTFGVTGTNYGILDYPQNQVLIYANDTVSGGANLALMANDGFYFMPSGQTINDATIRVLSNGHTIFYPGGATPADDGKQVQIRGGLNVYGDIQAVQGFGSLIAGAGAGSVFASTLSNAGFVLQDIVITGTQGIHLTPNNTDVTIDNAGHNVVINMNGTPGFTGTVTPVTSITVKGGIVTNVS